MPSTDAKRNADAKRTGRTRIQVELKETPTQLTDPLDECSAECSEEETPRRKPLTPADKATAKLWKDYKAEGTKHVRNKLIETYLPLVRSHAERLKAKLPGVVQLDDLTTAGVLGLMDAIEQFDPKRKVKFETFSAIRIRGAMMDELRGLDWVPRLVRQRAKILSDATAILRARLGRQPSDEELAEHLNVTPEEFNRIAGDATPAGVFSIYGKRDKSQNQNDSTESDDDPANLPDTRAKSPMLQAQHKVLQETLTRGFTRSERLIVILYYYEQLTMKEIGATLDLSESRVSQMHTSIVQRLRVTLSERLEEFSPVREVA